LSLTKAILVKDMSDWNRGFAAVVPLGDFEGGDLIIRQLGLGSEGLLILMCSIYTRKGLIRPIDKRGKDLFIQ
jgi:hypothetical protein